LRSAQLQEILMAIDLERYGWIGILLLYLVATIAIVTLAGGCILDPGNQIRQGLSQQKTYEWTDSGTIRVHGVGPQEESFLMMEGSIVMTGEGEVDWAASRITHYLRSEPSADEAMGAMSAILVANQQQSEAFYGLLETLAGALVPLIGTAPNPPPDIP
jgi:hypothetical protein